MSTATPSAPAAKHPDVVNHGATFQYVNMDQIFIDPRMNGRSSGYSDDEVAGLAASIEARGLIQNLSICKTPKDKLATSGGKPYILIAGYRRASALAKLARDNEDITFLQNVPCNVQPGEEMSRLCGVQLIENVQREDMNPVDIGNQIAFMVNELNLSQTELASQLGVDKSYVSNYLKIAQLPVDLQKRLEDKEFTFSHARELMRLPPGEDHKNWEMAADAAQRFSFPVFKQWVDESLEVAETTGVEPTPESLEESSKQKPVDSIKIKELKDLFLPRLTSELAAETDPHKKACLEIQIDTLNFVKDGKEGASSLATHFKPFLEEIAKNKAATKAAEEATAGEKLYIASLLKDIRNYIDPKNTKPGERVPLVTDAITKAMATVAKDRNAETGVVVYKKTIPANEEKGTTESIKEIPFVIPSLDKFGEQLGAAYAEDVETRRLANEKREKSKAEKAVADKAAAEGGVAPAVEASAGSVK